MDTELLKLIFRFSFDRSVRMHVIGYRPTVVCLIQATGEPVKYLLTVPEANHSIWGPPQEEIRVDETLEDAAYRCLSAELGIEERRVQFRRSCWLGKRVFPRERWDERTLKYSLRRITQGASMIGKAYFGALILADQDAIITPNRAEVYDHAWVDRDDYLRRVSTNVADKAAIVQAAWTQLVTK